MTSDVEIALIVAVASTSSPLLLSYLTSRQNRASKLEDYARQDAVAAQAAEAARLLSQRQDAAAEKAAEAARLLLAANERVATQTASADAATQGQLKEIHALVNSSLTAAIQAELTATETLLPMMREVIELNRQAGREPSELAINAVRTIEAKVRDLKSTMKDRLSATGIGAKAKASGEKQ